MDSLESDAAAGAPIAPPPIAPMMGADSDVLVVVDVQEQLCPVMHNPRQVLFNGARLATAATRLDIPCVVTEQYPKGLGPTMVDIRSLIPPESVVEKLTFASTGCPAFVERMVALKRPQAVVFGIESHVCVTQTALGLRQRGFGVFVVADACSSRVEASQIQAEKRLVAAGVTLVTTEMVLFEWLQTKENPAFKDIMGLIK